MRELSHWDDAPTDVEDLGTIGGTWSFLGEAVGALRLGVNRFRLEAGKVATPQHAEDEEVFYVLGGSGWSVQSDGCFAIGAGDVVYYPAHEIAHTVVAGDDGLDVIAMGTDEHPRGVVRFPRIDKVRLAGHLLSGDHTHQWVLENALPRVEIADPPDPRPSTIVNVADVEPFSWGDREGRILARPLGARGIALNTAHLPAGAEGAPLHCHSMEEELFVVLEGDGVLLLGSDEEEHPLRRGSVIGRPPGTGVAHAFRAGEQGMTLLMFSDKHPNDMTYYPRTGKVSLRGLGITIQPEIVPW
jgi:uncharacterized cupin superfamily protein